jgi:hypothetical protein
MSQEIEAFLREFDAEPDGSYSRSTVIEMIDSCREASAIIVDRMCKEAYRQGCISTEWSSV